MTISYSTGAYSDCFEILDQALENGRGMRIGFDTRGRAQYYTLRLNQARKLQRLKNLEAYEPDHPMHGQTPYDALSITIKEIDKQHWVYVKKIDLPDNVEAL